MAKLNIRDAALHDCFVLKVGAKTLMMGMVITMMVTLA